jgi:hypothetical protein
MSWICGMVFLLTLCLSLQVLDVLEKVFLAIFDSINEKCVKQLKAINDQYPFEPLQVCKSVILIVFKFDLHHAL